MIWKFGVFLFVILYVVYILTILAQILGISRVTERDVGLKKALIPFYYWIFIDSGRGGISIEHKVEEE